MQLKINCLSSYQNLNTIRTQSVKYHFGQSVCQRTNMCKCFITITHPPTQGRARTYVHTNTHMRTLIKCKVWNSYFHVTCCEI